MGITNLVNWLVDTLLRPHGVVVFNRTYSAVVKLTIATWCCYPMLWIFAEGTAFMSVQTHAWILAVLDVLSKAGVGLLIVHEAKFSPPTWEEMMQGKGNCCCP